MLYTYVIQICTYIAILGLPALLKTSSPGDDLNVIQTSLEFSSIPVSYICHKHIPVYISIIYNLTSFPMEMVDLEESENW